MIKINKRTEYIIGIFITVFLLVLGVSFFCKSSKAKIYDFDLNVLETTSHEDYMEYSFHGVMLPKGNYKALLGYTSDSEARMHIYLWNGESGYDTILGKTGRNGDTFQYSFTNTFPKDSGVISIKTPLDSKFHISFLRLESDQMIYSDNLIWGIVCFLFIGFVWFVINKKEKETCVIIAILVSILTLPYFLSSDIPIGGDLRAHLMRIDGIYFGLLDHQFPVVVNPQFNNTYGQLGILYPALFLYIPAFFRCIRMSLFGTAKIMFLIVNIVSCIAFFKCSGILFKEKWMRWLTVILLVFEYTHLYGVYNGGKLGGALLAEIFIPMIVVGIINILYQDARKWYYLSIGLSGVLCCHIISSVVAIMTILIIMLLSVRQLKNKSVWCGFCKSALLSIGLILGTYISFLRYYFTDWSSDNLKWRVFMDTLWSIKNPFFDHRWTGPMIAMIVCLIMIVVRIVIERKNHLEISEEQYNIVKSNRYEKVLLLTALILFYMATVYFPWKILRNADIIESFTDLLQSGNRFVGTVGVLMALCVPIYADKLLMCFKSDRRKRNTIIIVLFLAFFIFSLVGYIDTLGQYLDCDMAIHDEILGNIEYEYEDYLPTGTVTEYYKSDAGYVSDENMISSLEYSKAGTHVYYKYTSSGEGGYVEFPKFYYEGYRVVDENGNPIPFEKGDKNRIRVAIPKTDTPREIHINYSVPLYLSVLYLFSGCVWLGALIKIILLPPKEPRINHAYKNDRRHI